MSHSIILYLEGWKQKRSKCFFTYIHLDLFRSHHSICTNCLSFCLISFFFTESHNKFSLAKHSPHKWIPNLPLSKAKKRQKFCSLTSLYLYVICLSFKWDTSMSVLKLLLLLCGFYLVLLFEDWLLLAYWSWYSNKVK